MGNGFQLSSGRIIALGRLLLATLFLLAIRVDIDQSAQAPVATYAILAAYVVFAATILAATWDNWWLDARLAGPGHAIDILLFTLLVLLTQGYSSPYFTFFMFLLLSPAIRWGWLATALTAVLIIILYLLVGIIAATSGNGFEPQPFMVRIGHLVILSLILIWFGANRWQVSSRLPDRLPLLHTSLDPSPLEAGLRAAMGSVLAASGVIIWREEGQSEIAGFAMREDELSAVPVPQFVLLNAARSTPLIYDIRRNHAFKKDEERNLAAFAAGDVLAPEPAAMLALSKGLAIPIPSDWGEGELFLEGVEGLSIDHIDRAEQIGTDVAAHIQAHALLKAAEESAESRSRLTFARDLHDGVVQFLAGVSFRLEAMKRSEESGRNIAPEIDELKQLMMQEQRDLRSFIAVLREGSEVAFDDLATDLRALAERLSRQWDISCEFSARPALAMIPTRVHLDAHQLLREAVANAVRHAGAKTVTATLAAAADELRLEFINDGTEFRSRGEQPEMPTSIRERAEHAGGTVDMARGMGVTKISITLPIGERRD